MGSEMCIRDSSGIGAAISARLCKMGYEVFGIGRSFGSSFAEQFPDVADNPLFHAVVCDLLDTEKMLKLVRGIVAEAGVTLLVNNAGIYANMPAEEIASKTFCDIIDVNVKGTFFMTRHFVDLMIANHYGKIINLCSAVGLRAAPGSIAYASSKFAIRGMTQALAIDLGKYNIQVNAIAPGAHKTDMYWDAYKIDPELLEKRTKGCPLQRAGEVSEMYHIVRYFLASDFITGQVVSPNGGTTMV